VIFASLLLAAFPAAAQIPPPKVPATELVRQTVSNELAATGTSGAYMYQVREETPQGTETRVTVETRDWAISRLILKNDRPLPPTRRQREEESLRDLLTNRPRLLKLQADKRDDDARVKRVIQALPKAFLYQNAGAETNSAGHQLALVTFRPNPAFHPHSIELRVLQRVEGTMVIDPTVKRFVRVEVRLFADADFGWGIFDHISRGGSLALEQQVVWQDQRAITALALHYTNRRLMLITSRVDSVTKASDFRRLPEDLTLQQAFALLLAQDPMTVVAPGSGKTP